MANHTRPRKLRRLALTLVGLALGCGGTMNTGTAPKPANNKPAADGSCPTGESLCGIGRFAICADLQNDAQHCGTCDRFCAPGIACQGGACQQTLCTGTTMPLSGQPPTSANLGALPAGVPVFYGDTQPLADVNGDGRLDRIEWISFGGMCPDCAVDLGAFRVSLDLADGSFAPPDTYHASAAIQRVFIVDVNSDGLADLYVLSSDFTGSPIGPSHVELWEGQRDGHLRKVDAAGIAVDGLQIGGFDVAVADLSGDGWPDLVMPTPDPDPAAPPRISIYLSDSTGALHLTQTLEAWPGHAFVRDWNRDGSPDIVLLFEGMAILYNHGDGTFDKPVDCAVWLQGGSPDDYLVEDFNRDGWMDIAADTLGKRIGVMLGLGGCGFSPLVYSDLAGDYESHLRAADMNGDGILDLVAASAVMAPNPADPTGTALVVTDYLLAVLVGKGDGTFKLEQPEVSLGPDVTGLSIGEVTGDGRPDVVVSTFDGPTSHVATWENTCQ